MGASVATADLVAHLDDFLEVDEVSDHGPNGLQVEGPERIEKLVVGVSACRELFERAVELGAQAVMVHHGIFWDGMPYPLTGVQYGRVADLVRNDLALLAYHLPLDRHAEVGNNAVAARRLGLVDLEPFGTHGGTEIGWRGRLPEPVTAEDFVAAIRKLYDREPLVLGDGPDPLSTVGIISGGAQKEIHQAIAAGLDAFVTGEVSEWVTNLAREAGIHYLSAGHYATEVPGIRALGDYVAERFGIEVEWVDVPNPV